MADSTNTDDQPSVTNIPEALQPFVKGIKAYQQSGKHSDLVIKCRDRKWKVHKAYVCPQSEFFEAAVTNFKEGQDGVVELREDDPQFVAVLIHYFYNFDYGDSASSLGDVPAIVLDARMFAIGDKYNVVVLMDLATAKFEKSCEEHWNSPDFAVAVGEVYASGIDHDKRLKQVISSTVKAHLSELVSLRGAEYYPDFHKVLRETELGADVAIALASEKAAKLYKCAECYACFKGPLRGTFGCPNGHFRRYSHDGFWYKHVASIGESSKGI